MIRLKKSRTRFNIDFVKMSMLFAIFIILFSWIYIYRVDDASLSGLFTQKNIFHAKKFLIGLIGIEEDKPAFLDINTWKNSLKLTYETIQMSVMAAGFATIGMLLTVLFAARNYADGTLTLKKGLLGWSLFFIMRALYIFTRAIPELIWAMVIIFILKPGILPGAIALALHNFGILGKLCAEVIEDIDHRAIRNLSSSGAGTIQILLYGILPTVTPKFITFILYRWEVIIRTTIVVGFIGAGGLGQQFKLSMSWFQYTDITVILICYLLVVFVADILSEGLRKISQE
ncbi:PhnE/PtxC family ABC transporter permease [Tepidibacter mesophilus]|uniref:PhnE/PtxC family ABC transporter permease n=1 Tax=Tepidibacter mesophilus TaxID=655607 RepID=UPI000C07B1F4|nr:ABC transporter permease subunit [Tepidibacter mesophilus]